MFYQYFYHHEKAILILNYTIKNAKIVSCAFTMRLIPTENLTVLFFLLKNVKFHNKEYNY